MKGLLILGCVLAAGVFLVHSQTTDVCADCVSYAPDPDSCCFYYSCLSGNGGVRMACPPGLHFNPKLLVCDWPYRANCTSGGSPVSPTPSPPTPSPTTPTVTPTPSPGVTPPCTSTDPATLKYPSDCAKYYYCYQGYPYVVQCEKGQFFSEPDHACIVASECPSGGGSTGGTDFRCPDEYGTYDYPNDTTRYYYCYQSIPYTVQCYKDQHYDSTIHACAMNN